MANLKERTKALKKNKRLRLQEALRKPLAHLKDIPSDMGPNLRSGVAALIREAKKPAKTKG